MVQFQRLSLDLLILVFGLGILPQSSGKISIDESLSLASSAFDVLCSSTINLHGALQSQIPDINKIHFRHMTKCSNFSVPVAEADKLLNHKLFKRKMKTVFLATGWRNTIDNSRSAALMSKAFNCRNDVNFVVVDMASYMNTMYKWAAINTEEVGNYVAIGLAKLVRRVPVQNIHLVGHSLGAHIMGIAGRSFTRLTNGLKLPRITGLDPAKPCFGNEEKLEGLRRTDARLVDVVHTNNGVLGAKNPLGVMDFYPGGVKSLQAGCSTIDCSHSRAIDYFIESIYPMNEKNFPSYGCKSWEHLEAGNCSKVRSKIVMGYKLQAMRPGIFYVDVNAKSPFGVDAKVTSLDDGTFLCRRQREICI